MRQEDVDWLRTEIARWSESLRASVPIENWLDHVFWEDNSPHDIRRHWDRQERWYWSIPDFETGRSRVVGVEGEVLREFPSEAIQAALQEFEWLKWTATEDLLVQRSDDGSLKVVPWNPVPGEKWFPDPRGGFYYAYEQSDRSMWGGPPFLCMKGKTWSAMGPKTPGPVSSYSSEDLHSFLPKSVREPE